MANNKALWDTCVRYWYTGKKRKAIFCGLDDYPHIIVPIVAYYKRTKECICWIGNSFCGHPSGIKRRTNRNLTLNPMPFPPCECIPVRIYQLMLQNCKSCKQGHVRFVITIHLSRRISKLCDSSYRLNFDTKQHWHYDKAIIRLSIKVALSMTLSEQGRSKSPFL